MRVLHVVGGDLYGGIERMLATFAATRCAGLVQQFAASPSGRLWGELAALDVELAPLPPARASRPLSVLKARRDFARTLVRLESDVALFHGSWAHAMFATVARSLGRRVAFWQHAPILDPRWPDRWAARTAPDILIANSRFTARAPAFQHTEAHIVHCPVPPAVTMGHDERIARRAALGVSSSDVVVLLAARFEGWKGHRVLVDAARLAAVESLKVWIAGGVQRPEELRYRAELQAHVTASGLEASVALLGERTDVPTLMQLADIYCQPNTAPEPFGIAIAEAMHAGRPCIVSDAGGATELVSDECGLRTPPGDAAAVAAALRELSRDHGRRDAMGQAGRVRVQRLTDPGARLAELSSLLGAQVTHAA